MIPTIQLGGKTNVELGFIVLRGSKRPILPGTVDRTLNIPGRHGAYDFGANLGVRLFEFPCAFNTSDTVQLQQSVASLAAFLVDSQGKPRGMGLVFLEDPNKTYNVRLMGELAIERMNGYGAFTLRLAAFDPFGYGPDKIVELTVTSSPTIVEIVAGGNIKTSPVIVLTNQGPAIQSFTLQNEYLVEE